MADVQIDADVELRLARSPEIDADMGRRAANVQANAKRVVHVDPDRDVSKDGPHLRDTIYAKKVGDEWRVGSDARHAIIEEFGDSPKHGGLHSYLRSSLNAAGR